MIEGKNYHKPRANQVFAGKGSEHIKGVPDFFVMPGFVTFIVPGDSQNYVPTPGKRFIGVGDPRPFHPGARIMVDTISGKAEVTVVKKVRRRVIELDPPLNSDPQLGGDVYKVLGEKTIMIDTKQNKEYWG